MIDIMQGSTSTKLQQLPYMNNNNNNNKNNNHNYYTKP